MLIINHKLKFKQQQKKNTKYYYFVNIMVLCTLKNSGNISNMKYMSLMTSMSAVAPNNAQLNDWMSCKSEEIILPYLVDRVYDDHPKH